MRQRLKLASVSPALLALYREDEMTLDQLMAFTISEDHAAQEAVWAGLAQYNRDPAAIRRALTAAHVRADDKRVRFVGLESYQAAGGAVLRDLFKPEHEGYLTDAALLDRLAVEKAGIRGCRYPRRGLEVGRDRAQGRPVRAQRLRAGAGRAGAALRGTGGGDRAALGGAHDALLEAHGDDPEDEIAEKLEALSDKIDLLSEQEAVWRAEDIARAGALVSIGHQGGLWVTRGLVRPEDRPDAAPEGEDEGSDESAATEASRDPAAPLPARLIEDLTAHRTMALRTLLAEDATVALAAVAHALALRVFYRASTQSESCLALGVTCRDLRQSADAINDSKATLAFASLHSGWQEQLPEDASDLFGWMLAQDATTVTSLIAVCAASSVDAVRVKKDDHDCPRLVHADGLAEALGLDMAEWWQPTTASYLGRVPKPLILKAVAEGVSADAAQNIAGLKKAAMASHAEQRLAATGWLPSFLRAQTKPEDGESQEGAQAA